MWQWMVKCWDVRVCWTPVRMCAWKVVMIGVSFVGMSLVVIVVVVVDCVGFGIEKIG